MRKTKPVFFEHHQNVWKHCWITTAWPSSLFTLQLHISIYSWATIERSKQRSNACAQCCHSMLCRLCQCCSPIVRRDCPVCTSQLALCSCLADAAHCCSLCQLLLHLCVCWFRHVPVHLNACWSPAEHTAAHIRAQQCQACDKGTLQVMLIIRHHRRLLLLACTGMLNVAT
jgi:hypothetical protein